MVGDSRREGKFTMDLKVLNLDGVPDRYGDSFPPDCDVEIPEGEVPVRLDFEGDPIGMSKLERDGDSIKARVTFFEDDRLKGSDLGVLVPAMGGRLGSSQMEGGVRKVTSFSFRELGLSIGPNADRRIGSIKEQQGEGN